MNYWSALDRRVLGAWDEFAATAAATEDRSNFVRRLYRSNFPHTYPPPFLTAAAAESVADIGWRLTELITDMPRRAFGDDPTAWMRYLGVPVADSELVQVALLNRRSRRGAAWFMRPDLLVTADGMKLVELNVSTPMGGMSTLPAYFAATQESAFGRHLTRSGLRTEVPDPGAVWLDAFARLLEDRHAAGVHVFEAIANPADLDTGRRFFVEMVEAGGYQISCGMISDLDVSDSGVWFQGRQVDVVFTMYTWHETRRFVPPALTARLIEMDGTGAVAFIGSPATSLYDNKANLELLTQPEFAHHLSEGERQLVRAHVPATFRLRDATLSRALADQSRLVCKPASAYGGMGIAFGPAMDRQEWRSLMLSRLADPHERHVCQELVTADAVNLAGQDPPGREVVLSPLFFGGRFAGLFLRQCPPVGYAPINVKQGAEAAAVLTVATD